MNPATVRRALHATHALATLALLGSGLLLEFPELRARSVGGYGRRIVEIHLWAGASFAGLPLVALALSHRELLAELRGRLGAPALKTWRKGNMAVFLLASILLALTGLVLWRDGWFPLVVGDVSRWLHGALTIVVAVSLSIHVVTVRKKLLMRAYGGTGRE